MSSILKKSEVLKEMEEETKRRRAMAHRSLDFLGSRNMRRSRDLLVDDGVPAAPAHAWADANQRSAPVSTLGRPVLGQADHPAISGSTGYAYGPTAPPPAQQAESGTRSLVRSGSGTESMLFKFRRNQASSVVGMVAVDAAGGGAGAAGASGPPAGLSAAGGGGSQSPAGGAGAGAASPGSGGAGASGSSQSPSSDPPSAPAASIPTSFTAQNVSALRKNRMSTLASVVIPPQNPAANPPPKSAAAANAKSFKEWYVHILNGQDVNPVEHLMWAAKEYEGWKRNPLWNVREEESSASDAAQEDIDMAVRLVDIVSEARIAGLMYEEDLKIGDLDMVMLGSPKDLMDGLIFPLDQDMSFAEVFVATYRFFMPAQDLLDCLVGWYNADAEDTRFPGSEAFLRKNRKQIQNRAVRVLLMWIRNHWHDFHNDPRLYAELNFFVDYLGKVSFGNNQKLTQAIREQRLSWYTYQYIPMFSATRSGGPDQTKPWIAEWDIDDLAQNLTMIDHLHFRQLKPDMYLQLLHKPAQIKSGGFNVPFKIVMELCHWFRTVVAYTATVIAKEDNTKKKINYIKRFIKVAKACRDLSNYNTMFAIVYGLKRPAVLMWTQAWEGLPTKYMDQFKELDLLIDPADGYFNYNDVIRDQNPPAVPFLLPYIQDMIETHRNVPMLHEAADGEPKPINFQKFYHLYSIAAELEVFRLGSYHGKLKGDRESNLLLVNHMRSYAMLNDKALGEGLLFSSASAVSDWNETAAGASGNKAMKRATQMLSATKSDRPDGIKSLSQ
nr:hypothetical protein HK105_007584 [Polyrhizophydium stewartii]